LIDRLVDEITDGADERDGCSTGFRACFLAHSHGAAEVPQATRRPSVRTR
jgi:hypothetical protein